MQVVAMNALAGVIGLLIGWFMSRRAMSKMTTKQLFCFSITFAIGALAVFVLTYTLSDVRKFGHAMDSFGIYYILFVAGYLLSGAWQLNREQRSAGK